MCPFSKIARKENHSTLLAVPPSSLPTSLYPISEVVTSVYGLSRSCSLNRNAPTKSQQNKIFTQHNVMKGRLYIHKF